MSENHPVHLVLFQLETPAFLPLVTGEGLGEAALTLIFWFSWNLLLGLAHSLA